MFEATESRMAAFEQLEGRRLPPEMHTVLRLRVVDLDDLLADHALALGGLLDERLARAMLKTGAYLLRADPDSLFAWVAGGELSVLLDLDTFLDRRDPRELLARYAGQAAAKASLSMGCPVVFDCRLYTFPSEEQATDFFVWRQEAWLESTLAGSCAAALVDNGANPEDASKIVGGMEREEKQAVLANNGVDFEDLPAWQRGGAGIYWADGDGEPALVVDADLPAGEQYGGFIQRFLE